MAFAFSIAQIPYLTLLDLDVARYAGGWGRIKYVNDQLAMFEPSKVLPTSWQIPKWSDSATPIRLCHFFKINDGQQNIFVELENRSVFFSSPMDLDFSMLIAYPEIYAVSEEVPDDSTIKAVLGKNHKDSSQYSEKELKLFSTYHQRFKLGSKPAAHIDALVKLTNEELLTKMPESLSRLVDAVIAKLLELPE